MLYINQFRKLSSKSFIGFFFSFISTHRQMSNKRECINAEAATIMQMLRVCVCCLWVSFNTHQDWACFEKDIVVFFLSSVDDFVLFSPSHKVWVSALREKRIAKRFDSSYVHSFSLLRKTSRNLKAFMNLWRVPLAALTFLYHIRTRFSSWSVLSRCVYYTHKKETQTPK